MLSLPWRTKRIALIHMSINLTVVALYIANAYLRRNGVTGATIWLSVIAVAMLVVSGWLGGKLVYVHGVAVDPGPTGTSRPSGAARP
jgi:uncharacterized membrane protein